MTWNYPEDARCERCSAYHHQPEKEESAESKPPPPPPHQHADVDQVYDEFGRVRKQKDDAVDSKNSEWPPRFETNGTAFSLDARSGMFYQADSDFFYDPKSKLYYGNKEGAYYRYNEDTARFEQVQKVDQVQTAADLEPTFIAATKSSSNNNNNKLKGISIKLKTKALPKKPKKPKSAIDSNDHTILASKQQKQHAVDMEKWSDRQDERRAADRKIHRTAKGEPSKKTLVCETRSGVSATTASVVVVGLTRDAILCCELILYYYCAVCRLCQRKFPSIEKLLYHERMSKLHQENLAKQREKESQMKPSEPSAYVDRAEQRRIMNGPEDVPAAPTLFPASDPAPAAAAAEPAEKNLGETNIGNQLLQKMGWKAGDAVGRQDRPSASASLAKDWERIEALAAKGGKSSTGNRPSGLGA